MSVYEDELNAVKIWKRKGFCVDVNAGAKLQRRRELGSRHRCYVRVAPGFVAATGKPAFGKTVDSPSPDLMEGRRGFTVESFLKSIEGREVKLSSVSRCRSLAHDCQPTPVLLRPLRS